MIQNNYNIIQKDQEKLFVKVIDSVKESTKEMVKDVDGAASGCRSAANRAKEISEEFNETSAAKNLLWFAAPFIIIIDIAVRVIPWVVSLFQK
jgi:hypothetical protein